MSVMITAFIPTLNNERTLAQVIQGIKQQTLPPERIIVIDSGSNDRTKMIAEAEGAEFYGSDYFGLEFLGLGRARNRILELVDTPYLLSVDSDIVLEPAYIEKMMLCFELDTNIAGVAAKQIELNRIHMGDRCRATVEMRDLMIPVKDQKPEFRDFLLGSNSIYKVSALKDVGKKEKGDPYRPFEDALVSNYEDVDIGQKLRKNGYKLYWTPHALSYHLQKDTVYSYVNRAHRYRVFKWQMRSAYESLETYQGRKEHNFNYVQMGLDVIHQKSRSYLFYPLFYGAFYFFLEDAKLFFDGNKPAEGQAILNAVSTAIGRIQSAAVKAKLKTDLQALFDTMPEPDGLSSEEEIAAWLNRLVDMELVDPKFPAIHDKKLTSTDMILKYKVLESSILRMEQEDASNIYGEDRVLVLNATWQSDTRHGVRAGSRWPHTYPLNENKTIHSYIPFPFFLAQTYTQLQQNGFNCWMLDAIAEGYNDDECFYEIMGYAPSLIVMECSTPSFSADIRWAQRIKAQLPETKICFVGPHVSYEKEKLLQQYIEIDFAVYGEYEDVVLSLASDIKNKRDITLVQGLFYRDGNNVNLTGPAEAVAFEKLPAPDRTFLPFYNYNDRPIVELAYPSLQILLSRGCPFKCTFCLWPHVMFQERYQMRDVKQAVDEIRLAKEQYGIRSFYVDDDTFNIKRHHVNAFAEELIAQQIDLPWMAMARADTIVDEESLKALKASGLEALKFGIESVDDDVLKEMKKELEVQKCEMAIARCHELGIKVHLTFSIGYLCETIDSVRKTFEWMIAQNPDSMQISIVTPFPGTYMYRQALEEGYHLSQNWDDYDGAASGVVTSSLSTETLAKLHRGWIDAWLKFKRTGILDTSFLEHAS